MYHNRRNKWYHFRRFLWPRCCDRRRRGFIRREAIDLCKKEGIFYFHAVDKFHNAIEFDPRVLTAQYLVPFSNVTETDTPDAFPTEWVGWWAEIEGISMVHRTKLGNYSGLIAKLKNFQQVEYYYVAKLKRQSDGQFVKGYGSDTPLPQLSAPTPHRPVYATWEELTPAVL